MKKFFNLRNILLLSGALLILVAFIMSFFVKMIISYGEDSGAFNNVVWGCRSITASDGSVRPISDAGDMKIKSLIGPAVVPLIGILLMVIGAVAAVLVGLLVKKPFAKWIVLSCAAVILAGAIMQFFAVDAFCRSYIEALAKDEGMTDKSQIESAIKEFTQAMKTYNARTPVATVGGILGIVGALATVVSPFVPEKQ